LHRKEVGMLHAFYSDPHFGHDNIRLPEYADRPFSSVEEMDEALVTNYNEVVGPTDTVLWCGDAFFRFSTTPQRIMPRLNGYKVLVLGNHDRSPRTMLRVGFDLVLREAFVQVANRVCRVSHYPYAGSPGRGKAVDDRHAKRRPPRVKGEVLIHGHTHSKRRIFENQIHVGVDSWDFRPATFGEVGELVRQHFPV